MDSNPHAAFMPFVEALASVHSLLGGEKIDLAVLQFGLWLLLYIALVNLFALKMRDPAARWTAGIASYLLTGLLTIGLTFYAITPAMNWIGVAYLTLIWPFWIYLHVGVPMWLAAFMFTFDGAPS